MPLRFRILPAPPGNRPASAPGPGVAVATGPTEELTFELAADLSEVRVGRQPASHIELPFPAVSALHARLFKGESIHEWWLVDEGSTNGTWLDGQRLAPRRPALIRPGKRMRIGSVDIVFEGWSTTASGDEGTGTIARRLISDLFGSTGGEIPSLAVEGGVASRTHVRLAERERRYLVGRADSCDLVLPGEHASREHAAFIRRWEGVFVSDLGSRNGVVVNGAAISGEHRLSDGDRIDIGVVTLRLADPEDRYLRRLEALEEVASGGEAPSAATDLQPPSAASAVPAAGTKTPPRATSAVIVEVEVAPPRRSAVRRSGAAAPSVPRGERRKVSPRRSPLRTLTMVLAAGVVVAAVVGLIVLLVG